MTSTKTGRDALRLEIHTQWDGGDPQASAILPGFAVCDVLHFTGGKVPAEVDYTPGLGGIDLESYPDALFLELLEAGTVTHDDLSYWARVLVRFLRLVPEDQRY